MGICVERMIDFSKIHKDTEAVVPVLNGRFQYLRKKYFLAQHYNGWAKVSLRGNKAFLIQEFPDPEIIDYESIKISGRTILGYSYNDQIIFQNFDVAKRNHNFRIMEPLHLSLSDTFKSLDAIVWEDRNIYYYKPNYRDSLIYEVSRMFVEDQDINRIGGVTPELKTLYLFHDIERKRIKEAQEKAQREEEIKRFQETLEGRLLTSFSRVGARVLTYSIKRDRITVDWSIGSQEFNSIIDASTLRVLEAGYCMSGDDRRHNITSLVITAKDYDDEGKIYKTRNR